MRRIDHSRLIFKIGFNTQNDLTFHLNLIINPMRSNNYVYYDTLYSRIPGIHQTFTRESNNSMEFQIISVLIIKIRMKYHKIISNWK